MRTELKQLQQQTGITSIFVTHDQAESMALADRIVVMNKGRIEQIGSPFEIYERPRSQFVSEFVGSINVLEAEVADIATEADADSVLVTLRRGAQEIHCHAASDARLDTGQQVLVSIRPEKLSLQRGGTANGAVNVWHGRVAAAAYYGDHREYDVEVHDQLLKVTTPVAMVVQRGEHVVVSCDPTEVVVMAT
jgi:ABC-type Fe3+/spermidine/putrescine transport system ATPase subunit